MVKIVKTLLQREWKKAADEISHYDEYDYVIINADFDQALVDLEHILRAERLTVNYQKTQNAALIHQLLVK